MKLDICHRIDVVHDEDPNSGSYGLYYATVLRYASDQDAERGQGAIVHTTGSWRDPESARQEAAKWDRLNPDPNWCSLCGHYHAPGNETHGYSCSRR